MKHWSKFLISVISLMISTLTWADIRLSLYETTEQGQGTPAGSILISETPYGLLFTPQLINLSPGIHGFHIHEHPLCNQNGMAAGGHFDPKHTNKHLGPYNNKGHLGDLPALYVNADGTVTLPVLAPRIKRLAQIKNHALMVHAGGDNYADVPQKLGGGGSRMVCGVIKP